jgi:hypothetical protein
MGELTEAGKVDELFKVGFPKKRPRCWMHTGPGLKRSGVGGGNVQTAKSPVTLWVSRALGDGGKRPSESRPFV